MRHLVSGRKLKRTSSHRKALLKNLATALFEHKKIATTEAKAKELRPYAEKLISKAKHALQREKQGVLPQGQTIDVHSRREVGRHIRSKAVLQELFDTIAPLVIDRDGGYTRIVKLGFRRGDGGRSAIIELVDWAAPQDGAVGLKAKKKAAKPGTAKKAAAPAAASKAPATKPEATAPVDQAATAAVDAGETPDTTTQPAPEPAVEAEASAPEIVVEDTAAPDEDSDFRVIGKTGEENTEEKA